MSTLNTLGIVTALLLMLVIPGIPAAILITRRRTLHVAPTVALGLSIGLGIMLTIVVGLVHLDVFTTPVFGLTMAGVSVGLWIAAMATHPSFQRPKFTPAGATMGIILGAAVFLRTDPIYFIYQTADFGEYVNRANRIAAGGPFGEWFLNLYPALMSVPSLIFGSANTVAAMPLLGLLLVVGIAAISHRIGFPPWGTVVATFIAAFHIVPVWFSEFPASETLSAVLLVGMLVVLATALADRSWSAAVVAGGFGFLLAVARANAMLLAPVVVLASIAALVLMDRDAARSTARFIWAFYVASIVGFFYNITFNSVYFVEFQLGLFFPESVPRAVAYLSNPLVAIAAGSIGGLAVWGLIALARRIADRPVLARRLTTYSALGLLAGLFVFIALRALTGDFASPGGKVAILGPTLLALAIAGIVIGAFSHHGRPPERRVVYWISIVTAIAFTALQAVRLDLPNNDVAPYFLYWQRYYMSEVFPVAVILAFWPLEKLIDAAAKAIRSDRWSRYAPAAVAVIVMTAVGIGALGPNITVASGSMFRDSYQGIADIDELTSQPPDAPIIYIGSNELPRGWFWLNTARLVALPLAETFGRRVIGNQGSREPDLDPSGTELIGLLDALEVDTVYVISDSMTIPDSAVLAVGGWEMEKVGTADVTIERLTWLPDTKPRDQVYVSTTLQLHVFRMTR